MQTMNDIKISLSQAGPSGELSIVRVDGVVDTITASDLEHVIEGLIGQSRYKILVDLGGVEYISSAGWGIFISKIQEIREEHGDIKLVNMIPNVYEIYELLEFEHIIPAFETLDQGKKAFDLPVSGGEGGGEKVWKADEKIVPEPGSAMQAAFSPGIRGSRAGDFRPGQASAAPKNSDEVILKLVVEDPFSTIGELAEQAAEAAPNFRFGWWKVLGILRKHGLVRRRSRFRLARKVARGMK